MSITSVIKSAANSTKEFAGKLGGLVNNTVKSVKSSMVKSNELSESEKLNESAIDVTATVRGLYVLSLGAIHAAMAGRGKDNVIVAMRGAGFSTKPIKVTVPVTELATTLEKYMRPFWDVVYPDMEWAEEGIMYDVERFAPFVKNAKALEVYKAKGGDKARDGKVLTMADHIKRLQYEIQRTEGILEVHLPEEKSTVADTTDTTNN